MRCFAGLGLFAILVALHIPAWAAPPLPPTLYAEFIGVKSEKSLILPYEEYLVGKFPKEEASTKKFVQMITTYLSGLEKSKRDDSIDYIYRYLVFGSSRNDWRQWPQELNTALEALNYIPTKTVKPITVSNYLGSAFNSHFSTPTANTLEHSSTLPRNQADLLKLFPDKSFAGFQLADDKSVLSFQVLKERDSKKVYAYLDSRNDHSTLFKQWGLDQKNIKTISVSGSDITREGFHAEGTLRFKAIKGWEVKTRLEDRLGKSVSESVEVDESIIYYINPQTLAVPYTVLTEPFIFDPWRGLIEEPSVQFINEANKLEASQWDAKTKLIAVDVTKIFPEHILSLLNQSSCESCCHDLAALYLEEALKISDATCNANSLRASQKRFGAFEIPAKEALFGDLCQVHRSRPGLSDVSHSFIVLAPGWILHKGDVDAPVHISRSRDALYPYFKNAKVVKERGEGTPDNFKIKCFRIPRGSKIQFEDEDEDEDRSPSILDLKDTFHNP